MVERYDENNLKNGFFIQKWKNGKKFIGYFLKNKINGWVKFDNLEVEISGEFSNNFLNGYGEVYNIEENKLNIGYYINGILGGIGCEKGSDYIYLGYFIRGEKNGYGKQIWDDMATYEGEWKDDDFNGFGIYYYKNEEKKYIGEWKNSCKNGFGEMTWSDGKKYVGYFVNDKKDGFGIYYLKKDNFIINFWKCGKRHGLGKYIKDKNIKYQFWENDKPIEENIDESNFMNRFNNTIIKYRYMFKWNIKEILKFMDINE